MIPDSFNLPDDVRELVNGLMERLGQVFTIVSAEDGRVVLSWMIGDDVQCTASLMLQTMMRSTAVHESDPDEDDTAIDPADLRKCSMCDNQVAIDEAIFDPDLKKLFCSNACHVKTATTPPPTGATT